MGDTLPGLEKFPAECKIITMKRILFWLFALGGTLPSIAQQAAAVDPAALKYAGLITPNDARKHLSILASDEFEGRETGQPGAEKAANYIAAEFKKLGLSAPVNRSYFQKVPLIETAFIVNSFVVNQTALSNWKDFYFSGSPAPKTIKTNEIVFVGYGITTDLYDDLKNLNISGKVVMLINGGEPVKAGISAITNTAELSNWSKNRAQRLSMLQSKNPALIVAVSADATATIDRYNGRGPEPRMSIKPATPTPVSTLSPVMNITPTVANMIIKNSGQTFQSLKAAIDSTSTPKSQSIKAELSADFGVKITEVNAVNVMGYLEGTDLKNEILVLSSHYDHIGLDSDGPDKVNNGADDDGSGTTGVLEIARAFATAKKEGKGPRRSILFLTVVGEEKGLLGSEWYSQSPIFPLASTIANLNIDMIGRIDPAHTVDSSYCYLIGSDKLSTDLHKISETANATYTKMSIDYKYNAPNDPERIYYRSDHYNFAKHNIPIIFYFNGVHADYHAPSDEVSKINFNMLVKRSQLVFYTGWELANRDKRPVVDVVSNMPNSR